MSGIVRQQWGKKFSVGKRNKCFFKNTKIWKTSQGMCVYILSPTEKARSGLSQNWRCKIATTWNVAEQRRTRSILFSASPLRNLLREQLWLQPPLTWQRRGTRQVPLALILISCLSIADWAVGQALTSFITSRTETGSRAEQSYCFFLSVLPWQIPKDTSPHKKPTLHCSFFKVHTASGKAKN